MQTSERELIVRSLSQDADAYGQLVERYKTALYHHCFAIVRDEDVAEDIAQDTFIAAYYKLQSFDQSRRFSTWLFKIATNNALNSIKKSKKSTPITSELIATIVDKGALPEQNVFHQEIHQAVAKLEPKYQTVVSLYYWQGMGYADIAETMNVPEGSVKGWMNRAKKQLRKDLA